MPISDLAPYPQGHFRRVYDFLIAPACRKAGFDPVLASDVKEANLIVLDILRRLHSADMVLCDLSSRNPNVLFELGFRQAFNRPVILIKDEITERIFDISGLRDIPYDHTLRIDAAEAAVSEIADRMTATYEASLASSGSVNSLVELLSIEGALLPKGREISTDTQIVLDAIREIGDRVSELESAARSTRTPLAPKPLPRYRMMILELGGPLDVIRTALSQLVHHPDVLGVSNPVPTPIGTHSVTLHVQSDRDISSFRVLLELTLPSTLEIRDVRWGD